MTTRRTRRSGPKRQNMWLPFYLELLTLGAGSTISTTALLNRYLTDVGRQVPIGTTLGPIIGEVGLTFSDLGADPSVFARIYLDREGAAVGQASLELEATDSMWYATWLPSRLVNETAAGTFTKSPDVHEVRTRAMRKVISPGDVLIMQFDEASGDAGCTIEIAMHIFMKFP